MRSASTRQPSGRPKISFVFPVHDPEYGGGLLARTQTHIDALIELANRYHLLCEIIIVEWNPRQDRATFRESLRWPDDLGQVCLRFIEVPAEIHRVLPNADRIPIFEYIAKNVGLRRARGEFLLATNPDLFYSPALVRWLAGEPLSPDTFYRIDRQDLSDEIPSGPSLARQLRFCSQHVAHVHALFASYQHGDADSGRRLRDEYERCRQDPPNTTYKAGAVDPRLVLPADGLHRNAAGDFFLMARDCWHQLRGYPELYTHAHIDAILCWVASSAGLVQEVLPPRCRLYHQVHHRTSHAGFPQTDWKPWYERYQEALRHGSAANVPSMIVNPPEWGLASEVLPEWQASPELVQVQIADGTEKHAGRFRSSPDGEERAQKTVRERVVTTAETSAATSKSGRQRAPSVLEARSQEQAALKETRRLDKAERAALKAARREAKIAGQSEAVLRETTKSSTGWHTTWPLSRVLASLRGLRSSHHVASGQSEAREQGVIVNPKNDRPGKASLRAQAPETARQVVTVDSSAAAAEPYAPRTLARSLSKRFRELEPLRAFNVPGDAPRVSVVADSLSANSLLAGVSTALVTSALVARHLGARLRVITLTEPADPGNVAAVFTTNRIAWTGDIEFVHVGPGRKEDVPVSDHELFVTTSWWSTRSVLPIVDPSRLLYLLQEDERLFHPWGDERLRCEETLSDPNVRFAINSRLLFEHLTNGPDALPNILANGVWFEPAFPAFDREPEVGPPGAKRQFFFYARPDDVRSLYWRGMEAIGAALEANVLDPSEWAIHLAGTDKIPIELPRGVRPNIVQDLPWADYVALVRRMDVALCLNGAPYPSHLPLDLSASGPIVVTNQHRSTTSLASCSNLIILAEPSVDGLTRGIAEAAARAAGRDRREGNLDGDQMNGDWEVALAPVLAGLHSDLRSA